MTLAETCDKGVAEARTRRHELVVVAASLGRGADGAETCRRIKAVPNLQLLPVVVYTPTSPAPEICNRMYDAGCDAFVSKAQMKTLDRVVEVLLRSGTVLEELREQNRLLELENRRLEEERQRHVDIETVLGAGQTPLVERELAAARPDGVLIVNGGGVVLHADRGACEMLGSQIAGKTLGGLVPASGLEAFVRDAHAAPREGFRFDVSARKDRASRSLMASVIPTTADGVNTSSLRVVLLLDLGKRRIAEEVMRARDSSLPREQLGSLVEAARDVYRPEALLGRSTFARRLQRRIVEAADERRPLLIQGEPGTGKELVSRIVHYCGRATGPMLQFPCGSLSGDHLEHELFGYKEGAFPEAVVSHPGLFLLARDGTLVLVEIGELDLATQQRVLDALEKGSVLRAGSRRRERANLRLIATSSRNLREMAANGRFLPELLERVGHGAVVLAPLRERTEDLEDLLSHFVERAGAAIGGTSDEALGAMQEYGWPGNLDELEECIQHACGRVEEGTIELEHLPRLLRNLAPEPQPMDFIPAARPAQRGVGAATVSRARLATRQSAWAITDEDPISLEFYEKQALTRALHNCNGDKIAAAKLLNVGKSTLYRKLKRYGIGG